MIWSRYLLCSLILVCCGSTVARSAPAQSDGETAVLGTFRMVPSQILDDERRILVRLPDRYHETDGDYPVIYLLHGTPWSFFSQVAAKLHQQVESGNLPEFILVGIEQHGHEEMRPRGIGHRDAPIRATEFQRFLAEDLIPFVDRHYRTRDYRVLLGSFDCGLFAIFTWLTRPELFHAYLTSNPGHGLDSERMLAMVRAVSGEATVQGRYLHLSHRPDAEGRLDVATTGFLIDLEARIPAGRLWQESVLSPEAYDIWAPYTSYTRALQALFFDYQVDDSVREGGLSAVAAHYRALSGRLGAEFGVPESELIDLSDYLTGQRRHGEAVEVLGSLRERNPESLDAHFRLTRAYRAVGEFDQALASYWRCLEFDICPPFLRIEMQHLERSAAFAIERTLVAEGSEAAQARFRELRLVVGAGDESTGELEFSERDFNESGYRLLGRGDTAEAVVMFQLNVELYQESANAHDSLGEAYLAGGNTERAVASYRRSLALNPENENALKQLRQLGVEP
ncbi:MAG: alpha/beta hydrolase-fold protein [bacterium]